jgi:hypothetical protein
MHRPHRVDINHRQGVYPSVIRIDPGISQKRLASKVRWSWRGSVESYRLGPTRGVPCRPRRNSAVTWRRQYVVEKMD